MNLKRSRPRWSAFFWWCAWHDTALGGSSPLKARQGELLAKGKGASREVDPKEAGGKVLTRRTETAQEASRMDEGHTLQSSEPDRDEGV